jgi:hypothetical protein
VSEADCDCCGKFRRVSQTWYNGLETWACAACRGDDEEDDDEVAGPDIPMLSRPPLLAAMPMTDEEIEQTARASGAEYWADAVSAERERCARIVETWHSPHGGPRDVEVKQAIANAIRNG